MTHPIRVTISFKFFLLVHFLYATTHPYIHVFIRFFKQRYLPLYLLWQKVNWCGMKLENTVLPWRCDEFNVRMNQALWCGTRKNLMRKTHEMGNNEKKRTRISKVDNWTGSWIKKMYHDCTIKQFVHWVLNITPPFFSVCSFLKFNSTSENLINRPFNLPTIVNHEPFNWNPFNSFVVPNKYLFHSNDIVKSYLNEINID